MTRIPFYISRSLYPMKQIPDPRSAVLFTCSISIHILATPSCYEPMNMRQRLCSSLRVIVGSCGEVS
jgi:hypothetical protein